LLIVGSECKADASELYAAWQPIYTWFSTDNFTAMLTSLADPKQFDVDPDPNCPFDAVPYQTFHFDVVPYPDPAAS
jgi:hypothetical protein